MLKRRKLVMRTGRRITFTSSFISAFLTRMKWENSSLLSMLTAFPIRACMKKTVGSLRIAIFHKNQMFPLACTHLLHTCGLFRADSMSIMFCLAWTAWGIVLPDLGAAWMQMSCSWVKRPLGRSSVSRRPCVGWEGDLRSESHCCSQTGSSSWLPHCYETRQQRHGHPINEPAIILHQHSLSSSYKCRLSISLSLTQTLTHTHTHTHTHTQIL